MTPIAAQLERRQWRRFEEPPLPLEVMGEPRTTMNWSLTGVLLDGECRMRDGDQVWVRFPSLEGAPCSSMRLVGHRSGQAALTLLAPDLRIRQGMLQLLRGPAAC